MNILERKQLQKILAKRAGQNIRYSMFSPYYYTNSVAVAANSTAPITFNISSNYDFLLYGFSYKSSVNSVNVISTFDIQIRSNDEQILNDFIPNEVFNGVMVETSTAPDTRIDNGDKHFNKFDVPYFFTSNQTMIFDLRDSSGQTNTIQIIAKGIKLSY